MTRTNTFTKQQIYCCICGQKFFTDFMFCGGYVCSPKCKTEYEWRTSLYITGTSYRPKEEITNDTN